MPHDARDTAARALDALRQRGMRTTGLAAVHAAFEAGWKARDDLYRGYGVDRAYREWIKGALPPPPVAPDVPHETGMPEWMGAAIVDRMVRDTDERILGLHDGPVNPADCADSVVVCKPPVPECRSELRAFIHDALTVGEAIYKPPFDNVTSTINATEDASHAAQ